MLPSCLAPNLTARTGKLAQTAVALHLLFRDVCGGDFIEWLDKHIDAAEPIGSGNRMVASLRSLFGVSDKVVNMTISALLIGGRPHDAAWLAVGSHMLTVDTLVHNFMHRTGLLADHNVPHAFGAACNLEGHCAEIIRAAAAQIDARAYDPDYPANFPRLIRSALWQFCARDEFAISNGDRIDDRLLCSGEHCPVAGDSRRIFSERSRQGHRCNRKNAEAE